MVNQIEIISDQLGKAVLDGLFNDVWYYIKDFKNYKLQFILEDLNDDKDYTILGELNTDGYKDMYENYVFMLYSPLNNRISDPKFIPHQRDRVLCSLAINPFPGKWQPNA